MRIIIQRVSTASVTIEGTVKSEIGPGMMILLGIMNDDTEEDINWLCNKALNLRIFDDENGIMNESLLDIGGEILLVSQFTLYASTKKGKRPSYIKAARPEIATPIYESFIKKLEESIPGRVLTGTFGAEMKVQLINSGPVTIIIDSKLRE